MKNKKYNCVLTLLNSIAVPGLDLVIKSDDDLDNNTIKEILHLKLGTNTFFDNAGITRENDIILSCGSALEKIFFNDEMNTCKISFKKNLQKA